MHAHHVVGWRVEFQLEPPDAAAQLKDLAVALERVGEHAETTGSGRLHAVSNALGMSAAGGLAMGGTRLTGRAGQFGRCIGYRSLAVGLVDAGRTRFSANSAGRRRTDCMIRSCFYRNGGFRTGMPAS